MITIPSWSWAAWSGEDPDYPFLHAGHAEYRSNVQPLIDFDLVDRNHELVRIKERSWSDHPSDRIRTLWKDDSPPDQVRSPAQYPPFRTGQLHFWTSLANVRAIRRQSTHRPGAAHYTLFPSPSFQPDPDYDTIHSRSDIVYQDFIVVAAAGQKTLILLAIEWEDGIAYRVGKADVEEAKWFGVENRQWRMITLG